MRQAINIFLILMVVFLQITLMPKIGIQYAYPNLILLAMLILIFVGRESEAIWWAVLGGIFLDLVSPARFGVYIFSFIAIFFLASFAFKNLFAQPTLVMSAGIIYLSSLGLSLILSLFTWQIHWQILIEAGYAVLIGVPLYWVTQHYLKPSEEIKV